MGFSDCYIKGTREDINKLEGYLKVSLPLISQTERYMQDMRAEKSGQVLAEQQAHTSAELLSTASINVLYIEEKDPAQRCMQVVTISLQVLFL